jgi:hypothetical protein
MAYTIHGHYIPGSDPSDIPPQAARCGGVEKCTQCRVEARRAKVIAEMTAERMRQDTLPPEPKLTPERSSAEAYSIVSDALENYLDDNDRLAFLTEVLEAGVRFRMRSDGY